MDIFKIFTVNRIVNFIKAYAYLIYFGAFTWISTPYGGSLRWWFVLGGIFLVVDIMTYPAWCIYKIKFGYVSDDGWDITRGDWWKRNGWPLAISIGLGILEIYYDGFIFWVITLPFILLVSSKWSTKNVSKAQMRNNLVKKDKRDGS